MASTLSLTAVDALKARMYDLNALRAAGTFLDWDQQTYMPKGGSDARAEHCSILGRMAHEILVDDATLKLLEAAEEESAPGSIDQALCRVVRRNYDLATKIPTALVAEKGRLASLAHEKWVAARANNDFRAFSDDLEKMFEISRQEAEYLGYKEHIYDALVDQFEEGQTHADCAAMYATIKKPLGELLQGIQSKPETDDTGLYGTWDNAKQSEFTLKLVKAIGFDLERGRQDTAPHPFCTTFSIGDVRLTTRFKDYLPSSIFGSLHEAGHGVYEQGSPMDWDRTPLAGGVSMGVHESQSRTWENIVGRSKAFWNRFFSDLLATFPALSQYDAVSFYKTINKVEPSFIRVEADEVTYNLHTLVRFEIESDVLTGKLAIKDLPDAWNAKYKEYLGITPKNDSEGVLQDVHWSFGGIGYFPTYTIGNLLSYQIWRALQRDLGDTDALIMNGEFAPILGWLTEKVYSHGCRYTPKELVLLATGKPLDANDYVDGLTAKYRDVYDLS